MSEIGPQPLISRSAATDPSTCISATDDRTRCHYCTSTYPRPAFPLQPGRPLQSGSTHPPHSCLPDSATYIALHELSTRQARFIFFFPVAPGVSRLFRFSSPYSLSDSLSVAFFKWTWLAQAEQPQYLLSRAGFHPFYVIRPRRLCCMNSFKCSVLPLNRRC